MNHKSLFITFRIVALSFILSTAVGYSLAAWVPPSGPPPGNNTYPPINIGSATQRKTGTLIVQNWVVGGGGRFGEIGLGGVVIPTEVLDVKGNVNVFGAGLGNITASGKITSASTVDADSDTTLTTKDYMKDYVGANGDNLGDHTATINLDMNSHNVEGADGLFANGVYAFRMKATNVIETTALCFLGDSSCMLTAPTPDGLGNHTASQNLVMSNYRIINLAPPSAGTDAVNRDYVDNNDSGGSLGSSLPGNNVTAIINGSSNVTSNCPAGYAVTGINMQTAASGDAVTFRVECRQVN